MTNQLELRQPKIEATPVIIAVISLFAALIAVSFAAIFIRWSEQEIGPNATIFNRLWIATVVFGLWNGLQTLRDRLSPHQPIENSPYTPNNLALLLAVGIVSSTSLAFWAWSLTQTSVANSTVLRNLTPLFTSLGGWLIWGRPINRRFAIGMVIAITGAIALGVDDISYDPQNLLGDLAALLSALFYGTNLLLVEQLRRQLTAANILLWRCAIGSILTLPLALVLEDRLFPYSWQGWIAVISLAIICQALGQGLLIQTLNRLSSEFVALCLLLEPLLTAILAWMIFSEQLSIFNWVAFAIILAGLYLAKTSQGIAK